MPWTAKQLKLFRAAAHNPAIAKSSGIKQADAERMSKEGLKKMAGGGKAVVNKQDTRHGKMDMPFSKLNRFAGMKSGGMMKKGRTFAKGGHLESLDDSQSFGAAFREASKTPGVSTFTWRGKKYTTEMAKPTPTPNTSENVARRSLQSIAAPGGRARTRADEQNIAAPNGRASYAETAEEKRNRILGTGPNYEAAPGGRARTRADEQNIAAPGGKAELSEFKRGGMMKESKAMVGKEVAFMKKKGAPASMIKHEKAEMGAMRKGGIAKYAKGGGVSLMDSIEKYNEGAKETVASGERNTREAGDAAVSAFKKGNYGTALKEGVKGLGSAAKTLAVDVPVEAFRAGMNRLKHGEKMAAGGMAKYARGGAMRPKKDIEADQMKMAMKKGGMKYARGGSIKETMGPRTMKMDVEKGSNTNRARGEHGIQKRGHTRALEEKMTGGPKKFARGGGIESRGKTKGKMITMKGGGYC